MESGSGRKGSSNTVLLRRVNVTPQSQTTMTIIVNSGKASMYDLSISEYLYVASKHHTYCCKYGSCRGWQPAGQGDHGPVGARRCKSLFLANFPPTLAAPPLAA